MASYNVLIKPSAAKELDAVPRKDRQRLAKRIQAFASNPRPRGCEKLSGQDRYRVRQGSDRVIYEVQDQKLAVLVVKIGHRSDVLPLRAQPIGAFPKAITSHGDYV